MKTIGKALKEARVSKKYSRARLEKETKIKREFIKAIEDENWENLPEFPVTSGFVRNIAGTLKIDTKQALARLRRDYPPKALRINPKPDVSDKFVWSPRLTFLSGVIVASIFVLLYLGIQYIGFVRPPILEVEKPEDGEVVTTRAVLIKGKTDPEVVVRVNNQPVLVADDGSFTTELPIYEGTHQVEVKAISRSGKETVIRRNIKPELSK